MDQATKTTPRLQQPSQETRSEWLRKQYAIHGKAVPEHLLEGEGTLNQEDTESVLQVFSGLIAAPKVYTIAGFKLRVDEPTIGQIKKRLLPVLRGIDPNASPDAILSRLEGIDEFQLLVMDCVHFEDAETAPVNKLEWSDGLKISDGLELAEAIAESLDWRAIINRATTIQGKLRGVAR